MNNSYGATALLITQSEKKKNQGRRILVEIYYQPSLFSVVYSTVERCHSIGDSMPKTESVTA